MAAEGDKPWGLDDEGEEDEDEEEEEEEEDEEALLAQEELLAQIRADNYTREDLEIMLMRCFIAKKHVEQDIEAIQKDYDELEERFKNLSSSLKVVRKDKQAEAQKAKEKRNSFYGEGEDDAQEEEQDGPKTFAMGDDDDDADDAEAPAKGGRHEERLSAMYERSFSLATTANVARKSIDDDMPDTPRSQASDVDLMSLPTDELVARVKRFEGEISHLKGCVTAYEEIIFQNVWDPSQEGEGEAAEKKKRHQPHRKSLASLAPSKPKGLRKGPGAGEEGEGEASTSPRLAEDPPAVP